MDKTQLTRMLGISFVGLVVVLTVVLLAMSGNWENPDDELAELGIIVAAAAGLIGLGVVLWWRNRTTARPQPPGRFGNGFLITSAIAEIGMLFGFVFAIASETLTPFWVGAVLFVVSLVLLTTSLSQVEFEA